MLPDDPKKITSKASEWVKIRYPHSFEELLHRVQTSEFFGKEGLSQMAKKKVAKKPAKKKAPKRNPFGRNPSGKGKESKVRKLIGLAKKALRFK